VTVVMVARPVPVVPVVTVPREVPAMPAVTPVPVAPVVPVVLAVRLVLRAGIRTLSPGSPAMAGPAVPVGRRASQVMAVPVSPVAKAPVAHALVPSAVRAARAVMALTAAPPASVVPPGVLTRLLVPVVLRVLRPAADAEASVAAAVLDLTPQV
jgi:hypothetical protein